MSSFYIIGIEAYDVFFTLPVVVGAVTLALHGAALLLKGD